MDAAQEVAFKVVARECLLLEFAYKSDGGSGFVNLKIEMLAHRGRMELNFTGVRYVTIPAIETVHQFSVVVKSARLRDDAPEYSAWAHLETGDLLLMFTAKTFALS